MFQVVLLVTKGMEQTVIFVPLILTILLMTHPPHVLHVHLLSQLLGARVNHRVQVSGLVYFGVDIIVIFSTSQIRVWLV